MTYEMGIFERKCWPYTLFGEGRDLFTFGPLEKMRRAIVAADYAGTWQRA